jgi:hypothetical protein
MKSMVQSVDGQKLPSPLRYFWPLLVQPIADVLQCGRRALDSNSFVERSTDVSPFTTEDCLSCFVRQSDSLCGIGPRGRVLHLAIMNLIQRIIVDKPSLS